MALGSLTLLDPELQMDKTFGFLILKNWTDWSELTSE